MNLTTERLTLATYCSWWLRPDIESTASPLAVGTQQLRALREIVRLHQQRQGIDWRRVAAIHHLAPQAVDRVRLFHNAWSEAELAKRPWVPGPRIAYRIGAETARSFDDPIAGPGELVAQIDLQQIKDDSVAMLSLRTGVVTAGEPLEIRAMALALARLHGVKRVTATTARVAESGVSHFEQTFEAAELAETAQRISTGRAQSADPVPGWHCRGLDCPAFVICPRV